MLRNARPLNEYANIPESSLRAKGVVEAIRGTAAMAFLALNTLLWCLPIYALGALKLVMPRAGKVMLGNGMFLALDGWVRCARWMVLALGVTRIDSAIDEPAESPWRRDGWFIVVSNHQSWADILVLVVALCDRLPPFKFFTKRELIWVPLLGVALWFLDYPLVRRYGRARLAQDPALGERERRATRKACDRFGERPTSVLIFLEGTRFTLAKRDAQQSPYQSLLRPKAGGVRMVLEALDGRLDAIVDVTITYAGSPPDFWDFLCGRCPAVRLRARTVSPPDAGGDAVRLWADTLWQEKDRRLMAP